MILTGVKQRLVSQRPFLPCGKNSCFPLACKFASLPGAADDARYFQISVPVQPGNSGGALVDERGNVIGIVSANLDASAALAVTGALPENVNYAVKSSFLLSFLESTPDVSAKLKAPISAERTFDDVVNSAQQAAVLVLVY
jgi:S1-C subfamily serine protease